MKTIFHNLLDFLFPTLCPGCKNRLTENEKHICLNCINKIPKTNFHLQKDNKLESFFAGRIPFERITAFAHFVKGGVMQPIIHELKYKNNPQLGVFLGELCGADLKGSEFIEGITYIVPIPLHTKRIEERGYNQSLEIAKGISSKTKIPIDDQTVVRTKNNPSQAKSGSRFERWSNVENIFSLTDEENFKDKHILLIDDVLTTGSTIEACAKKILNITDCKISILTIATAH